MTQDWLANQEGLARPEPAWSWRDEGRTVLVFALADSRGEELKSLNRNGLVMVDIKPKLLRILILDPWRRCTQRFQWLNLWGAVVPDESKYHLSEDAKRVVVRLRKVHDSLTAGSWSCLLDVRTGSCFLESVSWPPLLQELQGAWRSEDEEPIEILGDQVIWPRGSRDQLMVEDDTLLLQQAGDGGKVPFCECRGFLERQSYGIRWEDGDLWHRIPGLPLARQEAGREALPLVYHAPLARWVPWLPPEEHARRSAPWLPSLNPEVAVVVRVEEPAQAFKEQLMDSLEGDSSGHAELLRSSAALPGNLLRRCRVASLEALPGVEALLALRRGEPLGKENEAAALGGLTRWLQWLRCWLAPGSRQNVDAALDNLKEQRLRALKAGGEVGTGACWPPAWTCRLEEELPLLTAATERLLATLRQLQRCAPQQELYTLFGRARRLVAEGLWDEELGHPPQRRCDDLARRWVRRYAEEGARSLCDGSFRRSLREAGFCIIEDALDWSLLAKIQSEASKSLSSAKISGHCSWLELCESELEDQGCQALASAVALLHQLQWHLSDWKGSQAGFRGCRWRSRQAMLWRSQPQPSSPTQELPLPAEEAAQDGLTAFLFLNLPAWRPDWGGALRCHLKGLQRDVWGDGGRLLLLDQAHRYELLPASEALTLLIMTFEPIALPRSVEVKNVQVAQVVPDPIVEDGELRRAEARAEEAPAQSVEKVQMSSREVIDLFERSLPSAFNLD